ncbi:MAG: MerR family transcriptional regulator [Gammaproteobacteria bacterium]|nr:MerR family transcriptional regulator [Gammaproteobacteria bacterium]MCD8543049.1 MerR family transcriptional regulator [Gammaproteobacteria bacterium]MCD8573842.1 MerR family transcriptional regulator [Gammaproteobacteria bacterium]
MITIGQLAKKTDVTIVTIRHYEKIGLLHSKRSSSGYRCYQEEDIITLNLIKHAKQLGFSLTEIAEFLHLDKQKAKGQDVKALIQKKMIRIEEQLLFLRQLKKTYQKLLNSCSGEMPLECCPIMRQLKYN